MSDKQLESPSVAITEVNLPLKRVAAGKVREMFELDPDHLLMVATDRISAYDEIMAEGIPGKGRVLTDLSVLWFNLFRDLGPNHMVSSSFADLPEGLRNEHPELKGRSMIVRKLEMLKLEFVIRGYLVGSGWKEYQSNGQVCGISLPAGLQEASKLADPIFTPATKAEIGHDENISAETAAGIIGKKELDAATEFSLELYRSASAYALERGIILADTKFEFGLAGGEVVLADEVLTPDSSRFWPASSYVEGATPESFDKQYLRDWLDSSGWDRTPPPPHLPEEVVKGTQQRYLEAFEKLAGKPL
ncbi:MAG: phosphoribosylaminoimidazolesuccinocarboxamide synthase [Actinomycetota bacterium]